MNPKQFLMLGYCIGTCGSPWLCRPYWPYCQASLFGENWWFDNGENWAHLVLGVVALIAAYALKEC